MAQPTQEEPTSQGASNDQVETSNDAQANGLEHPEHVYTVKLKLPHEPRETKIQISTQEQVQDVRQSIIDQPFAMQYSCFHLEHNGERINDFVELSEVKGVNAESVFSLVEDPYTEKEARMHIIRMRELVGAAGEKIEISGGYNAGSSLHDSVIDYAGQELTGDGKAFTVGDLTEYTFDAQGSIDTLRQHEPTAPKTVKSIELSAWNPPPSHLRSRGHLLYLVISNLEGEQFHITSHVSGFFVNRSSHNKFDPAPKEGPKGASAHSLLTLLYKIDSQFEKAFNKLLDHNSKREPLALFTLTNSLPANPWIVAPEIVSLAEHRPDVSRTQDTYLQAGTESNDNLRDWNEEFQSTRELPTESVPDKVFRERLTSRLFADFNDAAVKGAVMVARGEIAPLNPTEAKVAQIFVYNNVFFSFGADGVGTFATEGGDEAARVATGKDVGGVQLVNQLDIQGLFTAGSVIVDYLGKRIVGQSIVPGIFRQKEPDEPQIDYGGVEGKDVIAEDERFVKPFEALSKATYTKKHAVWDKEGKRHDLEAGVDTKGLRGTDGRNYVLDLYRLTPLDINWIEKHWGATDEDRAGSDKKDYPHRMSILRHELVANYRQLKVREYIEKETAKKETNGASTNGHADKKEKSDEKEEAKEGSEESDEKTESEDDKQAELLRLAQNFEFSLNPDVYSGQVPQTDEEKQQMEKDEADVRAVCEHLVSTVIPRFVEQLQQGDVGFPIDGESLTSLIHKRGINVRYLGAIADLSSNDKPRSLALKTLAIQEMVSRAFKHVAGRYLSAVPAVLAPAAVAHLLNALLGSQLNPTPTAESDEALKSLYTDADSAYEKVTSESLRAEIVEEVRQRYRHNIEGDVVVPGKELQMLREISLKLGLQLIARDYAFTKEQQQSVEAETSQPAANGNGVSANAKKSKKKQTKDVGSPSREAKALPTQTFHPEDIVMFVPVVKDAAPKSTLAEEAYEGGRASLAHDQKEIGQELLLESLSLYEQIYGILHPEVARMYLNLSNIYYNMDEKNAAAELARKAVVIAERTIGLDSSETFLAYLNLALYEHGCGRSALGLKYILHALQLSKIAYGPSHPDSVTIINNAAVMLQSMRRYPESRIWFEASVSLAETVSGQPSINTATLLFQLAQALALDKDHRAAVNRMKESTQMFRTVCGPEDRNTKEAQTWLDQLVSNAISVEKRAKDVASGKLRAPTRTNLGTNAIPGPGQSKAEVNSTLQVGDKSKIDQREIDDLVKYITGGDSQKKKGGSGGKKGSTSGAGTSGQKQGARNPRKLGGTKK